LVSRQFDAVRDALCMEYHHDMHLAVDRQSVLEICALSHAAEPGLRNVLGTSAVYETGRQRLAGRLAGRR
jgi:hypothetical protein